MSVTQTPRNTLITPKEASRMLRVTPRTVSKWCREGRVDAVKIGRVWRVRCFNGAPILRVID